MKDQFYNILMQYLIESQFDKQDDSHYVLKTTQTRPGMTMVINNRPVQQSPTTIEIIKTVEKFGDGSCCNADGTNEQEFAELKLSMTQNEEIVYEDIVCLYYEETDTLENVINQFIKI